MADPESDVSSDLYDPPSPPRRRSEDLATPLKRKLDDETVESGEQYGARKRKKPIPSLSPDLWRQVFRWCPPRALARLCRVCRQFNTSLNPSGSRTNSISPSPDQIWKHSRTTFHPDMPNPMPGTSERSLWRLLKSKTCEKCNNATSTSVLVLPFSARLCQSCLQAGMQSDSDLFLSSSSALMSLLTFALINADGAIIPTMSLRRKGSHDISQVQKIYWTSQLDAVQFELDEARKLGDQAIKDCFKSLSARKDAVMQSVQMWEAWLECQTSQPVPVSGRPEPDVGDATNGSMLPPSRSASVAHVQSPVMQRQRSDSASRHRDMADVQEMRAARRADIEQRCLSLEPPIPTNILPWMESFQAAMQITNPLTDHSWELLRERLIAQRSDAEKREEEYVEAEKSARTQADERRRQEDLLREIKELTDRNWTETQKPVRELLEKHADDVIRERWADGAAVNDQNSARFAAQALVDIRARFVSDPAHIQALAAGKSSSGPQQPSLVLENMKWIHDTKIKPITDPLGGLLFFCRDCSDARFKALDGVIQHFASKHTNDFSVGKTVVSWQGAAWPENPPFKIDPPNPDSIRRPNTAQAHPQSRTPAYDAGHHPIMQQSQAPIFAAPHPERSFPMPSAYGHGMSPTPYSPVIPPPFAPSIQGGAPVGQYGQPSPYYNPSHPGYGGQGSPFAGQSPYLVPAPQAPGHAHGGNPAGHQTPAPADFPYAAPINLPNAFPPMWTPVTSLYQSQKNIVAEIASGLWSTLSSIPQVPVSIRAHVVIHHVVSRFHQRFSNEPNLDLFTDSLNTHPSLRLLKTASHIACKTCALKNREAGPEASMASGGVEIHTLYSLLTHFRHVHVEYEMLNNRPPSDGTTSLRLDWKEDMIELPSNDFIRGLWCSQGMDPTKLNLIAEVIPIIKEDMPDMSPETQRDPNAILSGFSGTSPAWPGSKEGPRDDEYDPTQPVMLPADYRARERPLGRVFQGDFPQLASGRNTKSSSPGSLTEKHNPNNGPSPTGTGSSRSRPRHDSTSPRNSSALSRPSDVVSRGADHSNPLEGAYVPRIPDNDRSDEPEYLAYSEAALPRLPPVTVDTTRLVYTDAGAREYKPADDDDVDYVAVKRKDGARYMEMPEVQYRRSQ